MRYGGKRCAWALVAEPRVEAGSPCWAGATEWLLPYMARAAGGYFAAGVAPAVCAAIHDAARRQALFRFAPPPPFRLVAPARRARAADVYAFRSPFVSAWRERNDAVMYYFRDGAAGRPLVVLNPAEGALARVLLVRDFVRPLLAAGVDVAVPIAPGSGERRAPEDRRRGWAHSVGAALSAIAQLVHDNVAVEAWGRERGYDIIVASGVGRGGTVSAILAATTTRFDAYVTTLAGAHPGRVWAPPRALAGAVHARALARDGVRHRGALARLFDPVAPLRLPPPRVRARCTVVGLRRDPVVPALDVRELARHWEVEVRWLHRGRGEVRRYTRELAAVVAGVARRARDASVARGVAIRRAGPPGGQVITPLPVDERDDRDQQRGGERPVLQAVDVMDELLEAIGEEEAEGEHHRHAGARGDRVPEDEASKMHAGDARGREHGDAQAGDVARDDDGADAAALDEGTGARPTLRRDQAREARMPAQRLRAVSRQQEEAGVPHDHAREADRQGDLEAHHAAVTQVAGEEDRNVLGNGHADAGGEQQEERRCVGGVLEVGEQRLHRNVRA